LVYCSCFEATAVTAVAAIQETSLVSVAYDS
jgi:hypothetical protein